MEPENILGSYGRVLEDVSSEGTSPMDGEVSFEGTLFLCDIKRLPVDKDIIKHALFEEIDLLDDYEHITDLKKLSVTDHEIEEMKLEFYKSLFHLPFFQNFKQDPLKKNEVKTSESYDIDGWIKDINEIKILTFILACPKSHQLQRWMYSVFTETYVLQEELTMFCRINEISPHR